MAKLVQFPLDYRLHKIPVHAADYCWSWFWGKKSWIYHYYLLFVRFL